jgi:multidrug efflux system membrane fusion protein
MSKRSFPSYVALLAMAAGLWCLPACRPKPATGKKNSIVPVVVGDIVRKDMPVTVRAIGRVTSPATVSIKPQVTGTISEVHFADGQAVKKGDPLVTIDKRPFEVALEQAHASLAEAETKASNAGEQARRYASLDKTGSVSKEQVADFEATAKAALSAVQVAAAAVKSAQLQLDYCSIRAPIEGRAGKALVTAGNVVTANQTDLVVVNQLAPLEVTFSVAEQHLVALQRALAAGSPKVTARTSGNERQTAEGELVFIDNNVRATSGTIELKAAFRNDPQVLWPGQFVGIRVQVGLDANAVVAPAAAIQDGQDSPFVFVVKADKSAEMRKVTVDRTTDDQAVIKSGLEGGEKVVVDGQSRLTLGSTVEIVPPNAIPAPASAATPSPQDAVPKPITPDAQPAPPPPRQPARATQTPS